MVKQLLAHLAFHSTLSILMLIVLASCGMSLNQDDDNTSDPLSNEATDVDLIGVNTAANILSNQAMNHFQFAFECTKGQQYIDANQLEIILTKFEDNITLQLTFDLSEFGPIPTVYNRDFNKEELADNLSAELTLTSKDQKRKITATRSEHLTSDMIVTIETTFDLSALKSFKEGMHSLNLSIDTRYCSFFNVYAKQYPIVAAIQFDFFVPAIHSSEVFFNELVLNQSRVKDFLGANDWDNPIPEAGICVSYNGTIIIFSHAKNSYSYKEKLAEKFYHLKETDSIRIEVLDVDYGFNASDQISDTIVPIRNLEGGDYIDLRLKMVDKLLVYTVYNGRVN